MFVELQEQPFCPLIVVGQAGDDLPVPVPLSAHHAQLAAHLVDVRQCPGARLHPTLDGGIFSRQAEGIEAHGLHDVVAMHALEAAIGIERRVVIPVAHVQVTRWIGQHDQVIKFCFRRVVGGMIQLLGLPTGLPLLFDFFRVIPGACDHSISPRISKAIVTIQVSFSCRLRRQARKKRRKRGHLALRQEDCVPLHPLLIYANTEQLKNLSSSRDERPFRGTTLFLYIDEPA